MAPPSGPIFEVTSENGTIEVTNPEGPVVNLETVPQPYASIELDSAMGVVPQGTWLQVPFNVLGPARELVQDLGGGAGIGIPEDLGGHYDCEYILCLEVDDIDTGSAFLTFVMTTGGAPAGGNTLNGSRTVVQISGNFTSLPIRCCVSASVLYHLVDADHLELWAMGSNPPASDPITIGNSTGSLEAVRLERIIPE